MVDRFAEVHPEKIAAIARVEAEAAQLEDVADAIHLVIERLTDLVGADAALVDFERDGSLICCYATSLLSHEAGRVQEVGGSLLGHCFSQACVIRTPNIRRDPRFDVPLVKTDDVVSMVAVPLHVQGPAVGLVRVVSSIEDRFNDQDLSVARMMTGVLARILMHAVRREVLDDDRDQGSVSPRSQVTRFADRRKVELRQAERYGYPVSILCCRLNGYVDGETLHHLSSLVRATDECFRLDATEFAILMPGTSVTDASRAGARLRTEVERDAPGVGLEWDVRPLGADASEVA